MRDPGRVQRAPENFLDAAQIAEVQAGRRDSPWRLPAAAALSAGRQSLGGRSRILSLPEHSRSLGQPVAARGYGFRRSMRKNLQRRGPGLTRVGGSSVSFSAAAGPVRDHRPNGLRERHHQGWWDIVPRSIASW
jgi:sulfane dehydrogenase subunit SoxC